MSLRLIVRRLLLASAVLLLVRLGWEALAGGLRQWPRSRTAGQKVETGLQLVCGLLLAAAALLAARATLSALNAALAA